MKTQIREVIENCLQLNVDKQKTKTFVNNYKKTTVMKITNVTFNEKQYMTFEDFKDEIMFENKHIIDVKYKTTKKVEGYIGKNTGWDYRGHEKYNSVFIYFDCKLGEVKNETQKEKLTRRTKLRNKENKTYKIVC